jgi:xanthine/uracil permease
MELSHILSLGAIAIILGLIIFAHSDSQNDEPEENGRISAELDWHERMVGRAAKRHGKSKQLRIRPTTCGVINLGKQMSNGFIRFFLIIFVLYVGLNVAARLQVWSDATVVSNGVETAKYQGRVSRELLSGDYVIETNSSLVTVPKENALVSWHQGVDPISGRSIAACVITAILLVLILVGGRVDQTRKSESKYECN